MTVLFYRYGSICEPDIISTFQANNITVVEIDKEITNKTISSANRVELINDAINIHHPLFVFSINFFPSIAEICYIHKMFYLCWTVDAPVDELFSTAIQRPTNRIFMFDQAQYSYFTPYNPTCIYHLPLASAIERFDKVIASIATHDYDNYAQDISFVGSLYNEKNPLKDLNIPPYTSGYINGIINSSLKIYGYNFVEELINDDLITALKDAGATFYNPEGTVCDPTFYVVAHNYIGMQIAETERIRTLNELAKHFNVTLFTRSDTSQLNNVQVRGGVKTLTEMPKVFHLSKINLNMTIKPIQTGLPLRIFDIMGCGGFLMTNYQEELNDHFAIGTDLEAYSSLEELIDKCTFYLTHDDVRKKIALNGYSKIKSRHTYQHRITEMLQLILQ